MALTERLKLGTLALTIALAALLLVSGASAQTSTQDETGSKAQATDPEAVAYL